MFVSELFTVVQILSFGVSTTVTVALLLNFNVVFVSTESAADNQSMRAGATNQHQHACAYRQQLSHSNQNHIRLYVHVK